MQICNNCAETSGLINKAFDVITPDGMFDFEHPTAQAARDMAIELGLSWKFTDWADARELAHAMANISIEKIGSIKTEYGINDYLLVKQGDLTIGQATERVSRLALKSFSHNHIFSGVAALPQSYTELVVVVSYRFLF